MKSPSETSRSTAAPPAAGSGSQPQNSVVSGASTVCAQRALGRPWGPSAALMCPHRAETLTEQALLFLKLCEGGALPAHRKYSESPFICQVPLHSMQQGIYAKDSPGKADPLGRFQLIVWWPAGCVPTKMVSFSQLWP